MEVAAIDVVYVQWKHQAYVSLGQYCLRLRQFIPLALQLHFRPAVQNDSAVRPRLM